MSFICRECNKEMKMISIAHLRIHGIGSFEEYYNKYPEDKPKNSVEPMEVENEFPEEDDGTIDRPLPKVFDIKDNNNIKKYDELPLKFFLKDFDITEEDLKMVVLNFTQGKPLNMVKASAVLQKTGEKEAEKLKDKNIVDTMDINIAETLTKKYGFVCVSVKKGPPKTWKLEKKQ